MVNTEIKLIMLFAAEDGEALYSQQKQDQELTVAQITKLLIAIFRLKLKKVGKTTRPFRYDLNQKMLQNPKFLILFRKWEKDLFILVLISQGGMF